VAVSGEGHENGDAPVAGSISAVASEVSVRGSSASATASRNCHNAARALRTFRGGSARLGFWST
jgi:hypothetical protein